MKPSTLLHYSVNMIIKSVLPDEAQGQFAFSKADWANWVLTATVPPDICTIYLSGQ